MVSSVPPLRVTLPVNVAKLRVGIDGEISAVDRGSAGVAVAGVGQDERSRAGLDDSAGAARAGDRAGRIHCACAAEGDGFLVEFDIAVEGDVLLTDSISPPLLLKDEEATTNSRSVEALPVPV